jgi:drug/metabolite transporter (DMT)-like permease
MNTWLVLGLLSYLSYAISTSIDKYFMNNGHHPASTNTFKMYFDGAILLLIGFLFLDLNFSLKLLGWALVLGGLYAISGIIYFEVLKKKDVEIYVPYSQSTKILLTFMGSVFVLNESVNGFNYLGFVLILIGIYAVLSENGFSLPKIDKIILLVLVSVVLGAIYSLLVKKLLFDIKPIDLAITMYFSSAIFMSGYMWYSKERSLKLSDSKIVISAFFGAMGTFLLFSALEVGDAAKVFPMAGLQSVFVFIIALMFLKEKFYWHRLIGTIIVVIGIYFISI